MPIPSDLEERYVTAAIVHGTEIEQGNFKEVNRHYDKLTRIYRRMEKNKVLGGEMISKLLKHPNTYVRSWAAAHALGLGIYIDEAVEVLEQIEKTHGLVRLSAEMTLKVWREKGYEFCYGILNNYPRGGQLMAKKHI